MRSIISRVLEKEFKKANGTVRLKKVPDSMKTVTMPTESRKESEAQLRAILESNDRWRLKF